MATLDGLAIHFLHLPAEHSDAPALLLTHGWPSSVLEFQRVLSLLRESFHLVVPSLPGFGFSAKPTTAGWGVERIADAWDALMQALGYPQYLTHGGDWGSVISLELLRRHPGRCRGAHITFLPGGVPPAVAQAPTEVEHEALRGIRAHLRSGEGYAQIQRTRPQTLGYGLVDSPVALAAWLLEKFEAWTDGEAFGRIPQPWLLDHLSLWWLTACGASAARLYWESYGGTSPAPVQGPTGLSVFPREIVRPSERWARHALPGLVHYRRLERGGHFPAVEEPELFATEMRDFAAAVSAPGVR